MSSAGDVNVDGLADLLIGAPEANPNGNASGASYVVFGRNTAQTGPFPASFNLSSLDGTNGFRLDGIVGADRAGFAVSSAGDVDRDGIADLLIGAFGDPNGAPSGGYVVFGGLPPPPSPSPPPPPPPPSPPVEAALTNPAAAIPCTGAACNVRISCNLAASSATPCVNPIRLFVSRSAVRIGDEASDKAPRRLRFAAGVANIPPGANGTVRLKLTRRGKRVVGTTTKRTLRGVIEIRNAPGTAISTTRITIKLRKRP